MLQFPYRPKRIRYERALRYRDMARYAVRFDILYLGIGNLLDYADGVNQQGPYAHGWIKLWKRALTKEVR